MIIPIEYPFDEKLESVREGMAEVTMATKEKMEGDLEASRLQEKASTEEIDSLKADVETLKAKVESLKNKTSSQAIEEFKATFPVSEELRSYWQMKPSLNSKWVLRSAVTSLQRLGWCHLIGKCSSVLRKR